MMQQTMKNRGRPQRETAHTAQQSRDRIRLIQLTVCLFLFLAVFIGRGIFPAKLGELEESLQLLLTTDLDLNDTALRLLDRQGSLQISLHDMVLEVFGLSSTPQTETDQAVVLPPPVSLVEAEVTAAFACMDSAALAEHYITNPIPQVVHFQKNAEPEQETEPVVVPTVGAVLLKVENNGKPLPDRYTLDHLSLGGLETVVPVVGRINSDYGYRDHPIDGEYQFHGGLDIGAQNGDSILAFAAGTVDYVGKNSSYGLYLQLDHGNGIKSFYAHCSAVSVKKGQQVTLGQTIAKVGSTGSATGPHLHFELKCQGIHVDPTYYLTGL